MSGDVIDTAPKIRALLGPDNDAPVAIVGAPLCRASISRGRYDQAPETIRTALERIHLYDVETDVDLSGFSVFDTGDLHIAGCTPEEAFEPIRVAVQQLTQHRMLTVLLGGNNAITRGGVHGVDPTLQRVGLLTLDAHFDLRDTDRGLNNGNPIRALLNDGVPGSHISQIGIAPFANSKDAHERAVREEIVVHTLAACHETGASVLVADELKRLSTICDAIYVDFDIDVIDRALMPAAPGARLGGISTREFFAAARVVAQNPKVACIDLTEFDPSRDIGDVGALTAAQWLAAVLLGAKQRLEENRSGR